MFDQSLSCFFLIYCRVISPFHVLFLFTAGWSVPFMFCFFYTAGWSVPFMFCFLHTSAGSRLDQSLSCFVQGVPKTWNSVTNSTSSLLWISIVIPNFKTHNVIMSARVYFMKRVKDCKDVSIMYSLDEQWRLTSLLYLYTAIFLFY